MNVIRNLLDGSENLYQWTEQVRLRASMKLPIALDSDAVPDSGGLDGRPLLQLECLQHQLDDKLATFETLDSTYWVLASDAEAKGFAVDDTLKVCSFHSCKED